MGEENVTCRGKTQLMQLARQDRQEDCGGEGVVVGLHACTRWWCMLPERYSKWDHVAAHVSRDALHTWGAIWGVILFSFLPTHPDEGQKGKGWVMRVWTLTWDSKRKCNQEATWRACETDKETEVWCWRGRWWAVGLWHSDDQAEGQQTDGGAWRTDGPKGGWTHGLLDRRVEGRTDVRVSRLDGRTDVKADGSFEKRTSDGRPHRYCSSLNRENTNKLNELNLEKYARTVNVHETIPGNASRNDGWILRKFSADDRKTDVVRHSARKPQESHPWNPRQGNEDPTLMVTDIIESHGAFGQEIDDRSRTDRNKLTIVYPQEEVTELHWQIWTYEWCGEIQIQYGTKHEDIWNM